MTALFRRFKTWHPVVRVLVWVVVAVLVFFGVTWGGVPPLVRHVLQTQVSELIGRPVSVGEVSFHPWSLELTADGLDVGAAPGQTKAASTLHVDRVLINLAAASLWRWAPVVDQLSLVNPVVNLRRLPDGGYDVDDIVARFKSEPKKDEADKPLPRFALYNTTIEGGRIELNDEVANARHVLSDLKVGLPFLSTLASQRDVTVKPELSFNLNGSRFSSTADALPFADNRKTSASVKLDALDLAPYLGYLPKGLVAAPTAGRLSLQLHLVFEQTKEPSLHVSGQVGVDDVAIADAKGKSLASVRKATVDIADIAPMARQVHLSKIAIQDVNVALERAADGTFPAFQSQQVQGAAEPDAKKDEDKKEAGDAKDAQPWQLALDALEFNGGDLKWTDASTQPQASVHVENITLAAKQVAWPEKQPAPVEVSAQINGAKLAASGTAATTGADVTVRADGLGLDLAQPYLAGVLKAKPEGRFSTETAVHWQAKPEQLQVTVKQAAVDAFALTLAGDGKAAQTKGQKGQKGQSEQAAPTWRKLAVEDAQIDVTARTAKVGSILLDGPRALVSKDANGRWMYEDWLATGQKASATESSETKAKGGKKPDQDAWQWSLGKVAIKDGDVRYRDVVDGQPVVLNAKGLALSLSGYAPNLRESQALDVSVGLSGFRGPEGSLKLSGKLGPVVDNVPQAFSANQITARKLPLQALMPYIPALSKLEVWRADGSFTGRASYQANAKGPVVSVNGSAAVEGMRADARLPSQASAEVRRAWAKDDHQLLSWRALQLDGLAFSMAPGRRMQLDLKGSTLVDLFARLVITPQGKLNLQGLYGSEDENSAENSADGAQAQQTKATPQPESQPATATAGQQASEPGPLVNLGPIRMVNGRVAFSDQFVKPNYSANLSNLTGKLGAFSSEAPGGKPQMADLELQGLAQETAKLLISGKLNPLAKPLMLDVNGKVSDLDLPPLSPYSVKYAGYGIERGKLNVDVNYVINAEGQLTATNRIVLNQLVFGDHVEGGGNLPVKLAVALLADRDGVINVELPVSGSLNDPQFSIGGLVFRALGTLITKAVTAPFALIGSMFGGGSEAEMSKIEFDPGTKWLSASAREKLDKVAQVMQERPSLQLTVAGQASLESERLNYQRQELVKRASLGSAWAKQAEKEKQQADNAAGDAANAQGDASKASNSTSNAWAEPKLLTGEAYEDALTRLYRRSDVENKPRNMIGMTKKLPVDEMEKLLMPEVQVSPEIMQQVAADRAMNVRSYLLSKGVAAERVFLGSSRNVDKGGADWTPHVELQLGLK